MIQILLAIGFFLVAILLMGLALHFSQYKKRDSGCCGGLHCSTTPDQDKPKQCHRDKVVDLANRINAEELKLSN